MNLTTIYPRPSTAPLGSSMAMVASGALQFTRMTRTIRPTADSIQRMKKEVDDTPAFIPTLGAAHLARSLIPNDTKELLFKTLPHHLDRFRNGRGKAGDWAQLFGMVRALIAIEHLGVVRGQKPEILAAFDAMLALQERYFSPKGWQSRMRMTEGELDAMDEALVRHGVQVQNLTIGEFKQAIRLGMAWSRTHIMKLTEQWRLEQ